MVFSKGCPSTHCGRCCSLGCTAVMSHSDPGLGYELDCLFQAVHVSLTGWSSDLLSKEMYCHVLVIMAPV
jgi:hypothetical protein